MTWNWLRMHCLQGNLVGVRSIMVCSLVTETKNKSLVKNCVEVLILLRDRDWYKFLLVQSTLIGICIGRSLSVGQCEWTIRLQFNKVRRGGLTYIWPRRGIKIHISEGIGLAIADVLIHILRKCYSHITPGIGLHLVVGALKMNILDHSGTFLIRWSSPISRCKEIINKKLQYRICTDLLTDISNLKNPGWTISDDFNRKHSGSWSELLSTNAHLWRKYSAASGFISKRRTDYCFATFRG